MEKETDPEEPRRKTRTGWLALTAGFAGLALVVSTLGVVVTGPLTLEAQPNVVPSPSASPQDPVPAPAITAPSPSAGGDTEVFDAPDITVVAPPPPPKPGVRATTTPGGTSPYLGLSAASYCALKLPPFATSGSDVTAFMVAGNKERAQTGAVAYAWNSSLASTAQSWANTMAANHDANPGLTPGSPEWYAAVFYHSGGPYAENIAYNFGYSNPVNVAQSGWMLSTGHCLNIMNPNYTKMGAGKAQAADGSWFFAEEFIW
ncbi:MAG: hypothetical protein JW722_01980 [Demequinaceae bacterium]|nr:hypothetical protein [Demequinaceae bacterium]